MKLDTSTWIDKDFLAFLLIYASKADTKTTEAEVLWIKQKCQLSGFEHIMALYNAQSEYQNIQTIQDLREKFYPGEAGKVQLKEWLTQFFESDGQFSLLEQNVMRILTRLL
jgi:hypothetical protein